MVSFLIVAVSVVVIFGGLWFLNAYAKGFTH